MLDLNLSQLAAAAPERSPLVGTLPCKSNKLLHCSFQFSIVLDRNLCNSRLTSRPGSSTLRLPLEVVKYLTGLITLCG